MPLFDSPVPRRLLWPVNAPWPRRRAKALLRSFQKTFPEIVYEMDLDVELANAQALLLGGIKRVRLYGGLVRHRLIGTPGLAVAIAHETGHHLAGPPSLPHFKWLSSEDRADAWAETVGLQFVFGSPRAEGIVRRGRKQLSRIVPKAVAR